MATVHAFEFLDDSDPPADRSFYVIFGDDRFLQLLVRQKLSEILAGRDAGFSTALIDGNSANWSDVTGELTTVSLFNQGGGRIAIVESADEFVKNFRSELEDLVAHPPTHGHLVLLVKSWPGNTKLYKAINKKGCQIQSADPQTSRGSSKSRDTHKITKWIVARANNEHNLKLTQPLGRQLLEIVEWNLGRADQELAKLSLFVDEGGKVTEEDVQRIVGGWRAQSIWDAVSAATCGKTDEALTHLSNLLQSGEHPLALYGQLSWSLRRYGRLWEIISRQVRAGRKPDLSVALRKAGFRPWNDELAQADFAVKQLTKRRVKQIYGWLLETDLALKGTHSDSPPYHRGRMALEKLFFQMAPMDTESTSD